MRLSHFFNLVLSLLIYLNRWDELLFHGFHFASAGFDVLEHIIIVMNDDFGRLNKSGQSVLSLHHGGVAHSEVGFLGCFPGAVMAFPGHQTYLLISLNNKELLA